VTQALGILGLVAFGWLAVFQVLLAAGAPLGAMAWGGAHRVLPRLLRWGSLASAGIALFGAVVVAQASGLIALVLPDVVIRPALIALTGLFALSLVGNVATQSRVERLHGVPLTILLAGSTGGLALGL